MSMKRKMSWHNSLFIRKEDSRNNYELNFSSHLQSKMKKKNYKVFKDYSELKRAIGNAPGATNFYNLNRIKYNHAMQSFNHFVTSVDKAAYENFDVPMAINSNKKLNHHSCPVSNRQFLKSDTKLGKSSNNKGKRTFSDTSCDSEYIGENAPKKNLIDTSFVDRNNGKSNNQNEKDENLIKLPRKGSQLNYDSDCLGANPLEKDLTDISFLDKNNGKSKSQNEKDENVTKTARKGSQLSDVCYDSDYFGAKPHGRNLIDTSFFEKTNGKSKSQNEKGENLTKTPSVGSELSNACYDSDYFGAKPHRRNLIDISLFDKNNGKSNSQNEKDENLTKAPLEDSPIRNSSLQSDKHNKVINRFNNLLKNINCVSSTEITSGQTGYNKLMKNIISNNIVQRASFCNVLQYNTSDGLLYAKKRTVHETISSQSANGTSNNNL